MVDDLAVCRRKYPFVPTEPLRVLRAERKELEELRTALLDALRLYYEEGSHEEYKEWAARARKLVRTPK